MIYIITYASGAQQMVDFTDEEADRFRDEWTSRPKAVGGERSIIGTVCYRMNDISGFGPYVTHGQAFEQTSPALEERSNITGDTRTVVLEVIDKGDVFVEMKWTGFDWTVVEALDEDGDTVELEPFEVLRAQRQAHLGEDRTGI